MLPTESSRSVMKETLKRVRKWNEGEIRAKNTNFIARSANDVRSIETTPFCKVAVVHERLNSLSFANFIVCF
ncbi:hypothetical protein Y032_0012g1776 [Ancylostoma ceylanicum]|uniref:Uncharacterized protein n=1 Tax=Ancylostoma ceylanicum TaxID=53326 RepID=A0A016VD89_9BILA|nr:hypothetical protein Y032_0012g1776 [Ancylostoma ceylanicum]